MLLFVAMRFKLFGRESGWASYFLYLTVPFALCKGRQECHLNYSCSFAIIVFKILIDFGKGAGYIYVGEQQIYGKSYLPLNFAVDLKLLLKIKLLKYTYVKIYIYFVNKNM